MSLGFLLCHIGVTLGVLGSFMNHLWHHNRKKNVYDGDMVVYSGTMGDFWGVMGAKREAKEGQATNLHLPESARRPRGDRKETARRPQGWCREGARMVQGDLEYSSEKVLHRQPLPGGRFLTFLFDQRLKT